MCTTTTHYATHISEACSRGGNAQCDGFCVTHGDVCTCVCHRDVLSAETVEEMLAWHDRTWDVAARFEHPRVETLTSMVRDEIARLVREHGNVWNGVRGAEFRAHVSSTGHAYIYVAFS